jgi:hypothetical protein
MRIASLAPRPVGDTTKAWLSWAATSMYSEGPRTQVRRHCACWPPSGVMSDIASTIAPRAAAVRVRPHGGERVYCSWRHQGLVVTRGAAQQLYAGTVSRSGHTTDEHVHNVASRGT